MARALVIDDDTHKAVKRVRDWAENNVIDLEMLKNTRDGNVSPIGDDPKHVVKIPMGFRVVYSVEAQPVGRCKHLSVSVDGENWPHPIAVQEILKLFDFKVILGQRNTGPQATVYQENEARAISILEEFPDAD